MDAKSSDQWRGGGFKNLLCSPLPGEDVQFYEYSSKGLVQPQLDGKINPPVFGIPPELTYRFFQPLGPHKNGMAGFLGPRIWIVIA